MLTTDPSNLILVEILEKIGGTPSHPEDLMYDELLVDIIEASGCVPRDIHKRNWLLEDIITCITIVPETFPFTFPLTLS